MEFEEDNYPAVSPSTIVREIPPWLPQLCRPVIFRGQVQTLSETMEEGGEKLRVVRRGKSGRDFEYRSFLSPPHPLSKGGKVVFCCWKLYRHNFHFVNCREHLEKHLVCIPWTSVSMFFFFFFFKKILLVTEFLIRESKVSIKRERERLNVAIWEEFNFIFSGYKLNLIFDIRNLFVREVWIKNEF